MPTVISAVRTGALALGLLLCSAHVALAQVELLPLGATYRYLISGSDQDNPPGAEDPGFDDSAFSTGPAPFGFSIQGAISWGLFENLTARRHLYLNGSPTRAVLSVRFIGYGSFYINGMLVCQLSNCGGGGSIYQTIPLCDGILRQGDNVWVAVCRATCGAAYFDATITTDPTNVDRAPVVTAPATASGAEGSLITVLVTASDPDGDAISSLTAAPLPSGASFTPDPSSNSGTFDWTPDSTQAGSYNVTFTASNLLTGTAATTITVNNVDQAPVTMGFDFTPNTLNLRSMGHWVTAFLESPVPFTPADIDTPSVRLNVSVPVDPTAPIEIGDHDSDGLPDLMVKFNRAAAELTVSEGDSVPVTVTGTVGGRRFLGTDYIRVLRAVVSAPVAGGNLSPGTTTTVRWTTPSGIHIQSVAILSSVDDGATWDLEAHGLPNSGTYDWMVPNVVTDKARVAVVLVESADETGYIVDGVLGTSGTFVVGIVAGVDVGTHQEFTLRAATPNPTQQALNVTFSLPDSRPATIEVFDVIGRRVAVREVGRLGPGSRTVTLGERATLPSGVYLVRLSQAGRSLTTRAVVVR